MATKRPQTQRSKAAQATSRKLADTSQYTAAQRKGQSAVEIDLFSHFDSDGSGSLSRKELRRALQGVKKELQRTDPHVMASLDEELAKLDTDGDGEIELAEFVNNVPDRLRAALRAAGPKILATQQSSSGAKSSANTRFATGDERGKDMRRHNQRLKDKKKVSSAYSASNHTKAARTGAFAVEISLFREFDVDYSGTLTGKELRGALNMVRTRLQKATRGVLPGMGE